MNRLTAVLPILAVLLTIKTSWSDVPANTRTAPKSAPVTLEVTNGDDDGPGSLRQAIRDATPDSTIELTFTGTVFLTSNELAVDKNLTITGPGSSLVTVSRGANASKPFRLIEIASGATVSVSGVSLVGGFSVDAEGGGILNSGLLSLSDVRILNNAVIGTGFPRANFVDGGGCMNSAGAQLTLTNCTVTGNTCNGSGGGILNSGDLTVHNSTISNNTAAFGGGIQSTGTATITDSTIVSNAARMSTASNSEGGFGGGLLLGGSIALISDTISGNSAFYLGGGMNTHFGATVTITNCILAGNSVGMFETLATADLEGEVLSGGYNLIGISTDSSGLGPHDLSGTVDAPLDAHLGPLQDNGGPTLTVALLPGSPAIDQGVSNDLATDQRGMPRTADQPNIPNPSGGDGTDIGAFELTVIAPTLGNISTRLSVGTEDNVLIGGFIITGTEPKTVLLRGIGPSLSAFGVSGALADPVLELLDPNGTSISTNDNWQESPDKQAIINSGIPPTDESESAILTTLDPGAYTGILSGAANTTGVGLVEVYDLTQTADSKLANISTRGFVQTEDNVMIGGIIVLGTEPTKIVVRAIGPSLPVAGALADPTLELHDSNGMLLGSNDNWKDTQEAEIEADLLAPTDDRESAIASNQREPEPEATQVLQPWNKPGRSPQLPACDFEHNRSLHDALARDGFSRLRVCGEVS